MTFIQTTTLAPPAISTRAKSKSSHLDAIAMYPSSPLGVFPPPAPATRLSLRDRCGVNLTLQIDSPVKPTKVPGPWSPKGHVQPHRNQLPRRRNPKPCFANFHDKAEQPAFVAPKPVGVLNLTEVPTSLQPPKPEEPRLQAIIPAVWVAFGKTGDRTREEGFTHVVEICHADDDDAAACAWGGSSERRWDGSVQRLRLVLPAAAREQARRAALALQDTQIRAARDFMAECLPQKLAALPDQTDVRVLVTTPPGRPTDAMCVVGCYLAFVAGRDVESILRCIDEEESILSVWKSEVCGDEVERIEKVARGWP